jgi:hypothetical protein
MFAMELFGRFDLAAVLGSLVILVLATQIGVGIVLWFGRLPAVQAVGGLLGFGQYRGKL